MSKYRKWLYVGLATGGCALIAIVLTYDWLSVTNHSPVVRTKRQLRNLASELLQASSVLKTDKLPTGGTKELREFILKAFPRLGVKFDLGLLDPWEQVLVYRCPVNESPTGFRLYSIGPNGVDEKGGGDDISLNYEAHTAFWPGKKREPEGSQDRNPSACCK